MLRRALLMAIFLVLGTLPAMAQAFVYPLTGWITQGYWTRVTYRGSGYHEALDISSYSGGWKIVGAARAGTVRFAGWGDTFGWLVILKHENGYETYYGHSWQFIARQGQWVNTNQNIMYEGSSGLSSGPHTHWELRRWNVPTYMPGNPGNYVVRGRGLPYSYAGLGGVSGNGTTAPSTSSGTLSQIHDRIAVGRNKNGRMEMFWTDESSNIRWQYWTGSRWIGGFKGGKAQHLALGTHPDGRMELFYIGTNNRIYHNYQTAPNGGWSGERMFADVEAKSLSVATWGYGAMDVFWVGTGGHIAHKYITQRGWSANLAMPGMAKQIVAGTNKDGRMQIFTIATNDRVVTNYWRSGGGWSGEQVMGGFAQQLSLGKWGDGRLELFYVGTNRRLYHNYQLAPNSGWSGERGFEGSAKYVSVGKWGNGLLEVFYVGTYDALYHNWSDGRSWRGESRMPGNVYARKCAALAHPWGNLDLFYIGTGGHLAHEYWTGSAWAGPSGL